MPSIQRISISLLVSLDTTHYKKVSSSLGTCLTDLPSWLRSQTSCSGRRNVSVRIWEHTTNPYMLPYFIVLTAEVEAVRKKKKESRQRRTQQRGCLHVYVKSRLSAAHTPGGKDIYVNCRWLHSTHCTCECTISTPNAARKVLIFFTSEKRQGSSLWVYSKLRWRHYMQH